MINYTIYSESIWKRMLDKHLNLKELAIQCGVEKKPQKAKEIREKYRHNFGLTELSDTQRNLAAKLASVEFVESYFLEHVVLTGKFHYENGANDYANAAFDLVLADFEDSFRDWLREVQKRNLNETSSFAEFYEVFLDVIKLKMDYKVPYTKLFIRKLLKNSSMPKEDSLEIKQYFLKNSPELLLEVKEDLVD